MKALTCEGGGARGPLERAPRDPAAPASVIPSTMSMPSDALPSDSPPSATSDVAPSTPAGAVAAVGSAMPQRFRDRVRARTGASDVLAFHVGAERFAVDVRALDEAIDAPAVATPPGARVAALAGVVRLAGRAVPVFDAGELLGVCSGARRQLLLLRAGEARVGLLVDEVDDVVSLPFATIQPPPFDGGDDLLLGVTWGSGLLTGILDARALVVSCLHRLHPEGGG